MSFRFWSEQKIRWKDVDAGLVVNNAVYLTLVEQARYEYFRSLELLADEQFPFLLGETALRFEKPGRAGMTLLVGARVSRLGGKSFDMEYELRHEDAILVKVRATLVCVEPGTLRSTEIAGHFRRRISMFEGIPERAD